MQYVHTCTIFAEGRSLSFKSIIHNMHTTSPGLVRAGWMVDPSPRPKYNREAYWTNQNYCINDSQDHRYHLHQFDTVWDQLCLHCHHGQVCSEPALWGWVRGMGSLNCVYIVIAIVNVYIVYIVIVYFSLSALLLSTLLLSTLSLSTLSLSTFSLS